MSTVLIIKLLSSVYSMLPPPIYNIGKASTCYTERRKT
jgi:hypothetical protein